MHINSFTYNLQSKNIAKFPTKIRGNSKLLVLNKKTNIITHNQYKNFANFVSSGDIVVLNNTKVFKSRLVVRSNNKTRELLLLERHSKDINCHQWYAMHRGKINVGEAYTVGKSTIYINEILNNGVAKISCSEDIFNLCSNYGDIPLPPYLHRQAENQDIYRYQTKFAKSLGSVAAPTASLNFTNELIKRIRAKGAVVNFITLHVGLGTFLPIRTGVIEDHKMHSEFFEVPKNTIQSIQKAKSMNKKVIAVGTTVTRTLEHIHQKIFEPITTDLTGEANIFIYPCYQFKVVDGMLTNFHAPRSTVLMMAAAFAGWNHLYNAYRVALDNNYQFLSYGDSMLIL